MRTRHLRATVVILAITGIVVACASPAGGSPLPSAAEPSAPTSTTAASPSVTASPTPVPTPTAAPSSTPSPAVDLLVRLDVCADVCVDPRRVEYLADGRVIRVDLVDGRLVERRLSPAGFARVRARLAEDADLLSRDLNVDPVPEPGKEPPGHGAVAYTFIAPGAAGGNVTVGTVTSGSLDPGYWVPDPRIDRLTALGDALLDPDSLAGPDGWTDPAWSAYVPRRTAVFVHVREGAAPFSSPDVGVAGWPFGDDPRTFGEPFASTLDAWPIARCAVLAGAAASEAAAALPAGTLGPWDPAALLREGTMAWAERGLELEVILRVLLPDDDATPCGELWIAW